MSEQRPERHTLFLMDQTREGEWTVPARLELRGTRTNIRLDLMQATFAAPEVVVDLALYASTIEIVAGPDVEIVTDVKLTGSATPAAADDATAAVPTQVVRLTGYARLGSKVTLTRA